MFNVSILLMLVVAMGQILIASGCMETVVDWLNNSVIKSERDAEISMFCLSTAFGILIAAINTIAFSVAKARSFTKGELKHVNVAMNSGMYKNAFTCGIPNSNEVGNVFAAALGYVAGDADKGLESLAGVTPQVPAWHAGSAISKAADLRKWNM